MERNVRYYYVLLSIVKKFPFIGIQINLLSKYINDRFIKD